jgi:hypothetical protein
MTTMSIRPKKTFGKKKRRTSDPNDYLQWFYSVIRAKICNEDQCEPCSIRMKIANALLRARRSRNSGNSEAEHGHLVKAQALLDDLVDRLEDNEVGRHLQLSLAIYTQSVASYADQAEDRYQVGSLLSYMRLRSDQTTS